MINHSTLISVIVPCYNQAEYLDECLLSVFNQTDKNWECIIVNDGSIDQTEETAKRWLEKDSRFKYIYKENGGLSSARNAGLESASGNYIYFLDSDDLIDKFTFSKVLNCLETVGGDIVICNYERFEDIVPLQNNNYSEDKLVEFTRDELLLMINQEDCVQYVIACGKLYKKELFDELRFENNLLHEDEAFIYKAYMRISKAIFLSYPFYKYRINANSITQNIVQKNFDDKLFILDQRIKDYKECFMSDLLIESVRYKKWNYVYEMLCYDVNIARSYTKKNLFQFWKYCTKSFRKKFKETLRIYLKY